MSARFLAFLTIASALGWCSSCAEVSDRRRSGSAPGGSGGTVIVDPGGGGSTYMPPEGFTAADRGSWRLGPELAPDVAMGGASSLDPGQSEPCSTILTAVVRDFRRGDIGDSGHPDFQTFMGSEASKGIVLPKLGDDQKPVHATEGPYTGPSGQQTTSRERFDEWYRPVSGVNRSYLLELSFELQNGVLTFESSAFFPLDGAGWGNEQLAHNYHFTTALHTEFLYRPGDRFTFKGDDDLWVFINGTLVIDLGGLHPELTETIELDDLADDLDLVAGNTYSLDLFHAERRAVYSNFRVDTTLEFTRCYVYDPVVR